MLAQRSGFPTAFNPLETDENQAIWVGVGVWKGLWEKDPEAHLLCSSGSWGDEGWDQSWGWDQGGQDRGRVLGRGSTTHVSQLAHTRTSGSSGLRAGTRAPGPVSSSFTASSESIQIEIET